MRGGGKGGGIFDFRVSMETLSLLIDFVREIIAFSHSIDANGLLSL